MENRYCCRNIGRRSNYKLLGNEKSTPNIILRSWIWNLYFTPIKFSISPDCRPPARYFPDCITENSGGLQYKQNQDDLIFEKEYNLNAKPLESDLLVINKEASAQIVSDIGKVFKGHNIVEYKSPEDHLDIDTFYKSLAYACLYKSYGKTRFSLTVQNWKMG